MKKQTIRYTTPLDALIAIAKRLGQYENRYKMESEEFFYQYGMGKLPETSSSQSGPATISTISGFGARSLTICKTLREVVEAYLRHVEQLVRQCPDTFVERYIEEVLSDTRTNLRIRLRIGNRHLLAITEAIVVEADSLVFLSYTYHFQDAASRMVFRYDDSRHYRHLSSFPDHKHLPDTVLVSPKPSIDQVLREAIDEARKLLPGHQN